MSTKPTKDELRPATELRRRDRRHATLRACPSAGNGCT
jgi:hypothetical protein